MYKRHTLQTLTGIIPAKAGSIIYEGKNLTKTPAHKIVELGMAHVPEGRRVFAQLSVYQNLKMGAYTRSDKNEIEESLEMVYKRFPRLEERKNQMAGTLSGGNQQKVIIAREVTNDKELLIAVNPTRGLDVGAIEFVHKYLVEQRNKNRAVLLVSFELDEIMSLSDRIEVIFDGQITGSVPGKDADEKELGFMMAGGKTNE